MKGGRCEACQGDGVLRVEMHFLPDIFVTCDTCSGKRYNRETLEVEYRGLSIADALDITVVQALELFDKVPRVRDRLDALRRVGLGYLTLGQPATTLSGGEAQRVKLARELARKATGRTLYVLDEPTTGLHFTDIEVLLNAILELRDQGNTVVVIEHNLDVVACADWVIDLGPEGGDKGGEIVAEGTPEDIALTAGSHTGHYLKDVLARATENTRQKAQTRSRCFRDVTKRSRQHPNFEGTAASPRPRPLGARKPAKRRFPERFATVRRSVREAASEAIEARPLRVSPPSTPRATERVPAGEAPISLENRLNPAPRDDLARSGVVLLHALLILFAADAERGFGAGFEAFDRDFFAALFAGAEAARLRSCGAPSRSCRGTPSRGRAGGT